MTGPIPWFFRLIVRLGVWPDWNGSELLSMKHGLPVALIEELLARDLVVLDRVDADLFACDPLAGG